MRVTSRQARARRDQVWQLRIVERKSYRDIADQLKVSEHTVWQDMRRLAQEKKDPELSEKVQREHHTIYEALIDRWLPVALDQDRSHEGETPETALAMAELSMQATDKVARLLGDHARLHGLAMPTTGKQVSATELGEEFGKRVVEAMLQVAHGRQNKEAAIEAEIVTPELKDAEQTNPEH